MPQGSSAWVWMSIATTSSILGSINLDMLISWRSIDCTVRYRLYHPTISAKQETGAWHDAGRGVRDRLLETRERAETVGRHCARRAAKDNSIHPDAGGDRIVFGCRR